jgi:hypothetical protein
LLSHVVGRTGRELNGFVLGYLEESKPQKNYPTTCNQFEMVFCILFNEKTKINSKFLNFFCNGVISFCCSIVNWQEQT